MATPFNLPALGENVDAGTVVGILVAVGDQVEENQPVLEIETDKANLEVPSGFSGVVTEILVENGATAEVGAPVLMYEEGAGEGAADGEDTAAGEAAAAAVETTTPAAGEAAAAEAHEQAEAEAPAEETREPTPESSQTPSAPPATTASPEPSTPPAADAGSPEKTAAPSPPAPVVPAATSTSGAPVPAAPSVRRFAREIGLDIGQVPGTGPDGRISVEDVKSHSRQLSAGRAPGGPAPSVPASLPDFAKWGPVETEPMSNLRRAAAEHLSAAWTNIPHVTYADKADVTDMEALRKQFGPAAEAAGGKLTMTAIALKIVAAALKRFPLFNASVDMAGQEIIHKKYYHVGVAVDTDRGLVVPVIRDVDRKNMVELSVELSEVAARARDRKLPPDDMQGNTFTISNLGGFGGTFFAPIINAPDVAILGLARSRMEQVYVDGAFQPRLMLPLMISYDHRLIDGADGARFMQWLVQAFEEPFLLSLEG
ncbi:MAG: branched-chain alpha-keto acid dehydrogenase subunit E2 [Gemmatimonadetes bacterium]|nr:branched-chain alpha-keto acid dehydrogenase subunit E2 [Gemmatimonadota bacterium]MYG84534.1 branched-chain alpha-keto acid dehydrogenase subunit E2 [Gemmatimonadota bacterium]MYJ91337.1 branched-chain alpha-keto acid dehydrogenase subunit E2 [Gemmatimonadota bacterium]